jgi:hypothetical protein
VPSDSTNQPGAAPSALATLQPTTAQLGDIVQYDLRVRHPAAFVLQPPALGKALGNFEVVSSSQLPAQVQGSDITDHFVAQLQNFATGQQVLPPIDIIYQDIERKPHTFKTAPLTVAIQEVPPGPKDNGDIRGIVGVLGPVGWSPWWWLLLAIIVAGGLAYAIVRRKEMIEGPPPPPPVPADRLAIQRLNQLGESDWIEKGMIKEYCSAISDIVRAYLESGFAIDALERTTNELMRDLRKRGAFDPTIQVELKDLLESCDLVKFAKFRPTPEEARAAQQAAIQIVEKTRMALHGAQP